MMPVPDGPEILEFVETQYDNVLDGQAETANQDCAISMMMRLINLKKLTSFIKHVRPMTPVKPQISFC